MIRYSITQTELKKRIEAIKPGWLQRARTRTEKFRKQGFYKESSSIWGEVKPVYIGLQHAKCAYCEKQLEDEERGRAEHDVEHFRPKASVTPWRPPKAIRDANIPLTPPNSGNGDPGYRLLAYHPFNYATACKACNSALKSNKFPIAGTRDPDGDDPVALKSEKPYLIYPISDIDNDPERLICFYGLSPQPVFRSGHRRNRALVTITFFELDTGRRQKTLFRQRAEVIISLYSFLTHRDQANDSEERKTYQRLVKIFTSASSPHTNCARCFAELYKKDRTEAESIFRLAVEFLDSISE